MEFVFKWVGLVKAKRKFHNIFFVEKTPHANEQPNLSQGNSLLLKISCSLTVTEIRLQKPSYSDS